jgi:hypothetical protein
MKLLLTLLTFSMLACTLSTASVQPTPALPYATGTATVIPSATVGVAETNAAYEQAVLDANLTNVAYEGLFVDATVQSSQLTAQADMWTHEAALMADEYFKATGTAQATAVPMTQTAIIDKRIELAVSSGILTAQGPTAIVEVAKAHAQAETEVIKAWAIVWMMFTLAPVPLLLAGLLIKRAVPVGERNQRLELVRDGGRHVDFRDKPCTDEQMDELAEGVLRRGKTLAVGQWEGRNSQTFSRSTFLPVRLFFRENGLAVPNKEGELTLTDDGREFLKAWLEAPRLSPSDAEDGDATGNLALMSVRERLVGEA